MSSVRKSQRGTWEATKTVNLPSFSSGELVTPAFFLADRSKVRYNLSTSRWRPDKDDMPTSDYRFVRIDARKSNNAQRQYLLENSLVL